MGLIQIENMEFYSFHGHFKEEQIVGNKFIVDLTIETDMKVPSETDNLRDAVDYQRIYLITKLQMEKKSHLLEHIAGRIIDAIYAEMKGILKVTVKVSKDESAHGRQDRVCKYCNEQVSLSRIR